MVDVKRIYIAGSAWLFVKRPPEGMEKGVFYLRSPLMIVDHRIRAFRVTAGLPSRPARYNQRETANGRRSLPHLTPPDELIQRRPGQGGLTDQEQGVAVSAVPSCEQAGFRARAPNDRGEGVFRSKIFGLG
jgi:hypothetical protein